LHVLEEAECIAGGVDGIGGDGGESEMGVGGVVVVQQGKQAAGAIAGWGAGGGSLELGADCVNADGAEEAGKGRGGIESGSLGFGDDSLVGFAGAGVFLQGLRGG